MINQLHPQKSMDVITRPYIDSSVDIGYELIIFAAENSGRNSYSITVTP